MRIVSILLAFSLGETPAASATATRAEAKVEAKMFATGDGYELYMGRWSRLLAPLYAAFAGVKDGQRILDVGTGTGVVASALESALPRSTIVGVDPSAAFIAYATKNARSTRVKVRGRRCAGGALRRCVVRSCDGAAGDELRP
jgi:methylase of polypeptide subunit release factors